MLFDLNTVACFGESNGNLVRCVENVDAASESVTAETSAYLRRSH